MLSWHSADVYAIADAAGAHVVRFDCNTTDVYFANF